MRKLAGAFAAILGFAVPAQATVFTVDDYLVTLNNSDPGLVLYAHDVMPDDYSFSLNYVGDTHYAPLFKIGTTETTVHSDDWTKYPISVDFSFSAPPPPFGGTTTGLTGGVVIPWTHCSYGYGGCGYVKWDNPAVLSFGPSGDGRLAIWLTDEVFKTPGSKKVWAKFKLLRKATVPEPTSLFLVGLGLLATGIHARRRIAAKKQ